MKAKDLVKFKTPANEDERNALMVVQEMRGERVLVSDLRFSGWSVPPTNVYPVLIWK
jgi:RNase P/RNase MRP subunit POP5